MWPLKSDLVIFDTETTSTVIPEARIVEIAAMRIGVDGAPTGKTFHTLVNPEIPIPKLASDVHGIYDKDVVNAPTTDIALNKFIAFCENSVVTSYNLPYDDGVINCELDRVDYAPTIIPPLWKFDSCVLAKRLIHPTKVENYKQPTLATYYKMPIDDAHHADADVRTLYGLLLQLFQEFSKQYPKIDFKHWITHDMLLDVWRYGKYRLKRFEDTSLDYLRWAEGTLVGDELYTIRRILRTKYNIQ